MSNQSVLDLFSNDISIITGSKNELILFMDHKDQHSFLELLRLNNQSNNRTLVTLNTPVNVKKFLNRYQHFDGKLFLCLSGNRTSDVATEKILKEFNGKNIKDVRILYGISETGHQNLSEYLENKQNLQNKNAILEQPKNPKDANSIKPERISDSQQVESGTFKQNIGKPFEESQSGQNGNHGIGQNLGGNNAGNGLAVAKRNNLGAGRAGSPMDGTQPKNVEKNEEREHSVGRIVSGRAVSDRNNGGLNVPVPNEEDLEQLLSKYSGQKLTNEQVAEIVSAACFVSHGSQMILKENLSITNDLKDICNQYKSGGTAKQGRGILDEYYTDPKIVHAVRNLIKDQFKGKSEISVLEPSVGTGNFLNAAKDLGIKTKITAFEINETTAKIAKILHPETDIHFRSFETEFIDERGNKKELIPQYDLVIGNPPYGEHRGYYKGLGEESNIAKYEDYFVKRSLDVLKDGGTLAMVLPSGWLNRQNKLQNAEISNAFRLPAGAFAGTQIGTDIIILKKNSQKQSLNISNYFEQNPDKVLGEPREKTNRFGRLEEYIYGNLEDALFKLEQLQSKKETQKIRTLFDELFPVNEELQIKNNVSDEIKSVSEKDIPEENIPNTAETLEKINQVLSKFNEVKFKSPAILKEIEKYIVLQNQITDKPQKFNPEKLEEIHQKADKILQSQNEKNTDYRIQTQPNIQKKILKYHFVKSDSVIALGIQNNPDIQHTLNS